VRCARKVPGAAVNTLALGVLKQVHPGLATSLAQKPVADVYTQLETWLNPGAESTGRQTLTVFLRVMPTVWSIVHCVSR